MAHHFLLLVSLSTLIFCSCQTSEKHVTKFSEPVSIHYDSSMAPFYHGVASGDPLTNRVIIWTRVTPEGSVSSIPVTWEVSQNPSFDAILRSDSTQALSEKDYTVKADVAGLQPGQVYFYRFTALGKISIAGRTKTLPLNPDSVKLAVVSCANWESGYFNAYEKIASRSDVDAVVHLGDFIYEYGQGKQGEAIGRLHLPPHEIVSLEDYRTRYSQYRLDKGLLHMSQQHPLIAIWDDHEIANDSYTTGAQNHQPEEGDYEKRKDAARQAYYEWIPIREGAKHYRSFTYGNLAELIMLDERLEGRTKPVDSISDPDYLSESRSMLGAEQLAWFETKLKASEATWKVIGNQVMFADLLQSKSFRKSPRNVDSWDGFPAEKKQVVEFIQSNQLKDLIFVTGDTHASWAIEVATDVGQSYNPETSQGAFAVEFGTTSISSGNDDERYPTEQVKAMEADLLKLNPHIKYVNDRDHGYLILTLFPEKVISEWYYMETILNPESTEYQGKKVEVTRGSVKLK